MVLAAGDHITESDIDLQTNPRAGYLGMDQAAEPAVDLIFPYRTDIEGFSVEDDAVVFDFDGDYFA